MTAMTTTFWQMGSRRRCLGIKDCFSPLAFAGSGRSQSAGTGGGGLPSSSARSGALSSLSGSTCTLNSNNSLSNCNLNMTGIATPLNFSEMSPITRRRSVSPLFAPMIDRTPSRTPSRQSPISPSSAYGFGTRSFEPNFPQTEEDHLQLFHEKIIWNQEKSLLPLAHDISDWLNSILGTIILPCNLMENLETGANLCQLANIIQDKAAVSDVDVPIKPRLRGRFRIHAGRGSFFARDNVAIFINFCKELGVHENLLFETEDLVSHGELRPVLICLMEVGRLSVKYGLEPPTLVTLEQAIERQQEFERDRSFTPIPEPEVRKEILRPEPTYPQKKPSLLEESEDEDEIKFKPLPEERATQTEGGDHETEKENCLTDSGDSGIGTGLHNESMGSESHVTAEPDLKIDSDLDVKVNQVAKNSGRHCCCIEETQRNFKLRKLSEGKYFINGRTVFVRLLKGVHVMVRVGGGWETLEEFLVRNDPCRSSRGLRGERMGGPAPSGARGSRKTMGLFNGSSSSINRPTSSPSTSNLMSLNYNHTHSNNAGSSKSVRRSVSASTTPQRSRHSSRTSLFH